ncbi:hypothetical protein J2X77_001045 [Sphingobacterium sp. 2149]|nr:hypothetical protein [Sphingobacterium sp. 2149]
MPAKMLCFSFFTFIFGITPIAVASFFTFRSLFRLTTPTGISYSPQLRESSYCLIASNSATLLYVFNMLEGVSTITNILGRIPLKDYYFAACIFSKN